MKILALDSSGLVATVAIVEEVDGQAMTIGEYTVNYKMTHSQTLLPMLDEVSKMIKLDLNSIDAIAVAAGPGSFTGLRIGSATAKGLGLALNKPLVPVPTLEGLAYNFWGSDALICPIMDARRNQVYTGVYTFENGKLVVLQPQTAVSIDLLATDILEKNCLAANDKPIIFLGDGVPVHEQALKEKLLKDRQLYFAPAHMNRQRAASVGALALEYYKEGKVETAVEHQPDYLRKSQAEREREEREQQNQ